MAYLMIVDDDEDLAAVVAVPLHGAGHEVVIKSDTAAAMKEMQSRPPDLVILDVMFSGDDFAGFELARAMCNNRDLKRIPILMLTGINQKLAMNFSTLDTDTSWLPVTEFMDKPVHLSLLVSKVKSMLQGAGARANDAR